MNIKENEVLWTALSVDLDIDNIESGTPIGHSNEENDSVI